MKFIVLLDNTFFPVLVYGLIVANAGLSLCAFHSGLSTCRMNVSPFSLLFSLSLSLRAGRRCNQFKLSELQRALSIYAAISGTFSISSRTRNKVGIHIPSNEVPHLESNRLALPRCSVDRAQTARITGKLFWRRGGKEGGWRTPERDVIEVRGGSANRPLRRAETSTHYFAA